MAEIATEGSANFFEAGQDILKANETEKQKLTYEEVLKSS